MTVSLVQNFFKQTVSTSWATGVGNRYVSVKPTVTSGFLVLSPESITLREIVSFSAVGTDGGGDYVTVSARGLGGTTEQTHGVGEKVYMNITAQHIEEIVAEFASKLDDSQLDIDGTLTANDDAKIASQKATKTYSDTKVSKTGNETIAGVKTFSSSPIIPAPTADLQAATKKYADDLAIAGAPNASETVKGLVEEATQAEVDAGTAVGATGARLFVNPSKLNPVVTTLIPQPDWFLDTPTSVTPTDTTAVVTLITIPFSIIVNQVSVRLNTNVSVSPIDISLYSKDGQTKLFSVASAGSHSASTIVSVSVPSVVINPGQYWLLVNTDSASLMQILGFGKSSIPFTAAASLLSDVTSKQVLTGTYTITSGTAPTTLTLANITESASATAVCIRLDN